MFEFAVKGTVAGFNTVNDGRTFIKIQPAVNPNGLQRDERPGLLDILVPANAIKSLAMNALVTVRGKGTVYIRDSRDNNTGKQRSFTNYRYEAEAIEPAKA